MAQVVIIDDDVLTRTLHALLLIREGVGTLAMDANDNSIRFLFFCPDLMVVIFFDNAYPKRSTEFLLNAVHTNPHLQRHSYLLLSTFDAHAPHPYLSLAHLVARKIFYSPFNFSAIIAYIREEVRRLKSTR